MSDAAKTDSRLLETLLANAPDFIFFKDKERRFVRVSQPFESLLGRSESEILGNRDEDLFPPEVAGRTMEDDQRVIEEGIPLVNRLEGSEDPAGNMVWVLTTKIPWRDADGNIVGLFGISKDITDRILAEDALRVQRERLARFMDSATESFHLMDADLRVIEINETALARIRETGGQVQTKEDIVGRSLLDIYPFLRGSSEEARFREVLRTGEPLTYDNSAEHPTRGTVHMTVKLFTVGDDLGLIATDISDRKRAEEERLSLERQFLHAQKLESLGVLTGGIAHDFNNILVPILGYADLALAEMAPGAPGRNRIEGILAGARQAKDLVAQMLAYSGQGHFELRPIDLNQLVREMGDLLRVSVSKKSALKYDFAESLPGIEGDKTQMRQVIMNLITNASEAIGDRDGVITIATGTTDQSDHVYLEVTDTGSGMDEAVREKMFEPFFTTKFTGRGLGMSAVQGIVRAHSGTIEVHSQANVGTRIRVLFPVNRKQAEGPEDPKVRAPDEFWSGTGTVLVVDDEQPVRSLAKTTLEVMGFEVLEAADGREAVQVFSENLETIRAVILDLTMPHMDGEECFRELRKLRSDIPVILSSGYSEHEITSRFAGLGIGGFIQKPYQIATMRSKIRAVLEG